MDWAFVHKVWDKWAATSVGSFGQPLKAALLINHDPTGPSRLLSTIAEQEGMAINPIELNQFVDFIKRDSPHTESFNIGSNQYIMTSIHENWFCARCMNTIKTAGEGVIIVQTTAFILVAMYDGSIAAAPRAMAAADQFSWQLVAFGRTSGLLNGVGELIYSVGKNLQKFQRAKIYSRGK